MSAPGSIAEIRAMRFGKSVAVKQSHVERPTEGEPVAKPRGKAGNFVTTWPQSHLRLLKNMVRSGASTEAIATALLAEFGRRLSPTTIRVKLHRLGWVTPRQRPINRVKR